jgi:hypothetical protein
MLSDFMIGETYPENVLSEISLALFEDSGWYKVNYYTGGLFRYGKNAGCNFVQNKCVENGKTNYPDTFCLNSNEEMCFANRLAKGICNLSVNAKDLDPNYRYFDNPKFGGYEKADYCPVALWTKDTELNMYFSNSCAYGKSTYGNLGESISSTSSCFISSLIPKNINDFAT